MLAAKFWAKPLILCSLLAVPLASRGATCTTQSAMSGPERDALAAAGQRFSAAVLQQDSSTLQSALLPLVAPQWDSIREVVEQNAPVLKGGQVQLRSLYLLDASSLTSPADTQFFCSNASASLTITITMRSLPPGKYAVVLADAVGSAMSGQIGFILAWDANTWKIGGVFIRPGSFDGHDGVFYWQRARELSKSDDTWAAYYIYDVARYLLLPVDFISSPNLEKLDQEQVQLKNSPAQGFPYTVSAGDRTWKIDNIHFDPSLRQPDLGVTYESAGVTDPAALRTEAVAVLGALLKSKPALRQSFHGLWAYASNNGKTTPVMELPMNQIP